MLHIVHLISRRAGEPASARPWSRTGVKVTLALSALALAAGMVLLAAR